MTHKLELPGDGWAEMKDSGEITRGEEKSAENARTRATATAADIFGPGETTPEVISGLKDKTDDELQPFEAFQNLMAKICLVSWSRGALPAEKADFDAMPKDWYEAIVLDARATIFREPLQFGPDGQADPKAPTASSNGSAPTSTETGDSSEKTTQTQP